MLASVAFVTTWWILPAKLSRMRTFSGDFDAKPKPRGGRPSGSGGVVFVDAP
jgi:hypothetical protein